VSRLRNVGVANSGGELLVFVDADVSLTDDWYRSINAAMERIRVEPMLVTGSHCLVPQDATSLLEKYWFASFQHSASSHLGTGHLIMTRQLFDLVGGFSEVLETGEDYDICMRIRRSGGRIEEDVRLKVVHNDFPQTLRSFVRREAWHGTGDCRSLSAVFASKVAIASLMFLVLHFLILIALAGGSLAMAASVVIALALFLLLLSHRKFRAHGPKVVGVNAFVYYFYLAGRSFALIRGLAGK
jgi:cellulose synthase/poly-beta-1,6-N-acetylglucosamine synthase-like glycosyltransferase